MSGTGGSLKLGGGGGGEYVIEGYFSAATALGAGGQHVGGGGGGGSQQQMALDKGVGWGVWPSAPGAACELLPLSTERKELGAGKGCLYSEERISTHPHPPIHRLEPGKKAAGRGAREAKVRTAPNSHHLPCRSWKTWGRGASPSHESGPKAHLDGGRILLAPSLRIQGCSLRIRELTPGAQRSKARN